MLHNPTTEILLAVVFSLLTASAVAADSAPDDMRLLVHVVDRADQPHNIAGGQRQLQRYFSQANLDIVQAETGPLEIPELCLSQPACIRKAVQGMGVDGIVMVYQVAAGSKLEFRLVFYNAYSGVEVATRSTRLFGPSVLPSGLLHKPMDSGLAVLRPSIEATVATELPALADLETEPTAPQITNLSVREVTAEEPQPQTEPVHAEDSQESASHLNLAGVISTGTGVGLLAVGAMAGLFSLSIHMRLEEDCPNKVCPAGEYGEDIAWVNNVALTSDILVGTGLAAVVCGGILLVMAMGEAAHGEVELVGSGSDMSGEE